MNPNIKVPVTVSLVLFTCGVATANESNLARNTGVSGATSFNGVEYRPGATPDGNREGCDRVTESDDPENCAVIAAAVTGYVATKVADHYWDKYGEKALNDLDNWAGDRYAEAIGAQDKYRRGESEPFASELAESTQFDPR